jgi:tryptophan synthase alpha chain
LQHGVGLKDVLAMVAQFRERDTTTPVILMGYLNPIEIMGDEAFATAAQQAGVDGVLTVDLPPEEADSLLSAFQRYGLDPIFLLSPTTSDARIAYICRNARGFVYYVSLKGVTGSNQLDTAAVAERIAAIRRHTELPVGVGFGIKDAVSAASVAAISDGVVIGSALVARMEALAATPERLNFELGTFVAELRAAIDGV